MNPEYKTGLQKAGLRAFMGEDNKIQPGQLQDLMLHETAVSWLRKKLMANGPAKPCKGGSQNSFARVLSRNKRRTPCGRSFQEVPRQTAGAKRKGGGREGDRLKK